MNRRIDFFCANDERDALILKCQGMLNLYFYECGQFESAPKAICSAASLKVDCSYLLSSIVIPEFRKVERYDGTARFAVDQLGNENSLTAKFGGELPNDVVIGGHITTLSQHPESIAKFESIRKLVKADFAKKIGNNFVGPKAYEILKSGGRLTQDPKRARTYDLCE
jgi:hypothetical protein